MACDEKAEEPVWRKGGNQPEGDRTQRRAVGNELEQSIVMCMSENALRRSATSCANFISQLKTVG